MFPDDFPIYVMPIMAFIGVRISWLMLARNALLCLLSLSDLFFALSILIRIIISAPAKTAPGMLNI
jgi:hypothetical protein